MRTVSCAEKKPRRRRKKRNFSLDNFYFFQKRNSAKLKRKIRKKKMIVWSLGRLATWMLHLIVDTSCSESLWTTLLFILMAWMTSYLWRWWRISRNLPPGPYGFPIVGYLPRIKRDFHEELTALSRKYGSVFSVKLGSELIVVLSDHKIIREAFRREEFACRPDNDFMKLLDGYGIINTEGKMWKEQRRFLHERLRHFGMKHMGDGREKMEARIMNEVLELVGDLATKKSDPVDLGSYLSSSVSNVICSLLMSVRFRPDDPKFIRFTSLIDDGFKLFTVTAAAGFIPLLKLLPGFNYAFNKIQQNLQEISRFYQDIVEEHKKSFDANNIRDIIDGYILEIQNAKEEGRSEKLFHGKNGDRQMQQIIGDMFSAGTETVKTTLQWASVFALREPHMQARVQEELDRVVGRERMPSLDDLPNLPYTEAFMLEVMRRATAVPLGTTHSTSRTTTLNGYTIPKGTQVIPLIHAVHMNPALWKDPELFNPDRFLSSDGTKVVKPEYFIPFGVGRRVCLGDVLAKAELFLFFSTILHTFKLTLPPGATVPDLRGQAGVTVSPQSFKVCAEGRDIQKVDESIRETTEALLNCPGQ